MDDEIREQIAKILYIGDSDFDKEGGFTPNWDYALEQADEILAIPAIAKGLELRKKGKEIFELGDKILEFADHGDYSNGVEAFGIDEGRVRAYDHLKRLEEHWGTLKAGFRKVVTE